MDGEPARGEIDYSEMATLKIKFRPSAASDREGKLVYRFTHQQNTRVVSTGFHLKACEWDAKSEQLIMPRDAKRLRELTHIRKRIMWDKVRIANIIRTLDDSAWQFNVTELVEEFNRQKLKAEVTAFTVETIDHLRRKGSDCTAEKYRAMLSCFKKFVTYATERGDIADDVQMEEITDELMQQWEGWMKTRGLVPNTTSFYMRIMRAVYRRAVVQGIIDDKKPFRNVYTGIDSTAKRALTIEKLKHIISLDLSADPRLDYARDIFMLSFALRGMSLVDMAYLQKSDLRHGVVTYRRRKTNQLLSIEWTEHMQEILDKYSMTHTNNLLPIIVDHTKDARTSYQQAGARINYALAKIAKMVEVPRLTLYQSRHSWASAARARGIPTNVISEGLGHSSEKTTQIYLATLDTTLVDEANSLLLQDVFEEKD